MCLRKSAHKLLYKYIPVGKFYFKFGKFIASTSWNSYFR